MLDVGRHFRGTFSECPSQATGELCSTFVGTTCYMSPERLRAEAYSYSSDIWSFGLILLELASGAYPYSTSGGEIRRDLPRFAETSALLTPPVLYLRRRILPAARPDCGRARADAARRALLRLAAGPAPPLPRQGPDAAPDGAGAAERRVAGEREPLPCMTSMTHTEKCSREDHGMGSRVREVEALEALSARRKRTEERTHAYPVMADARFETLGPTGGTAVGRCTALSRSALTVHRNGKAQRQRGARGRARARPAGGRRAVRLFFVVGTGHCTVHARTETHAAHRDMCMCMCMCKLLCGTQRATRQTTRRACAPLSRKRYRRL